MECIGGLRTPWKSLDSLPKAREVGWELRHVIDGFVEEHPELERAADGDRAFAGNDPMLLEVLRGKIAHVLGGCNTEPGVSGRWRPGIVHGYQ